jgi:hypothetical protein
MRTHSRVLFCWISKGFNYNIHSEIIRGWKVYFHIDMSTKINFVCDVIMCNVRNPKIYMKPALSIFEVGL